MELKQINETINFLRNQGYAVVIFDPLELQNTNPSKLEDHLISYGWDFIQLNKQSEENEEF